MRLTTKGRFAVTAMIAFIIFAARLLSFVFQDLGATGKLSAAVLGFELGKYGTMAAIVVMYLILGMFFDSMAMMLLTLSFVMPIVTKLGFDPIWWGVTFVLLAEIGLVTPPFGLNLFTATILAGGSGGAVPARRGGRATPRSWP